MNLGAEFLLFLGIDSVWVRDQEVRGCLWKKYAVCRLTNKVSSAMNTWRYKRDADPKQSEQGLAKRVKFIVNLESGSENDGEKTLGKVADKVKFRYVDASNVQKGSSTMRNEEVVRPKNMQVRPDAEGDNRLAEMNRHGRHDPNEARGVNMGDGQELSEQDESRDDEGMLDIGDANILSRRSVHHQQPPQPQGSVIRWERFLPQRCLKVLLVENDVSTRQVVSALLRNCSYEVVAVANGQQAWKLLEDPSNHFDLVLTEVAMPYLSGIGLLCKIMSCSTSKNIPVIMMSSNDSMGTVFKCLSKGAVDFLVKPVRKNELKNLWQHVWRRCQSSSDSGGETGSQTQNVARPNSTADPDNNTGSNDESDDASIGLNNRDGSDNGSGTQISWTKRVVEVESPQHRSEWGLNQPHSSPIGQVIQQKFETAQSGWMQMAVTSEECQDKKSFDYAMGQDLEIAVPGQTDVELEHQEEEKALYAQTFGREENAPLESSAEGVEIREEPVETGDSPSSEVATKAADLIGAIANKPNNGNSEFEDNRSGEALDNDNTGNDFKNLPFLELTLKRPRQNVKEDGEPEDRHVLRQSGVSAFSRYNTSGSQFSNPSGDTLPPASLPKGYMPSGSIESEKTGSLHVAVGIERVGSSKGRGGTDPSTPALMHNQPSQSSNNQDLGSSVVGPSGQDMFPVPKPINDESVSAPNACRQIGKPMSIHPCRAIPYDTVAGPRVYSSAIHPIYYSHTGASLWGPEAQHINDRGDVCNNSSSQIEQQLVVPRNRQTQIHHHHHHHVQHVHYHEHHHQTHQHKHNHTHTHDHPKQEEQTKNNLTTTPPLCGSSNMAGNNAPDVNNGQSGSNNGYGSCGNGNGSNNGYGTNGNDNGSPNGSASGSNNGSNGQNGHSNGQNSAAVTPGGTNGESDTGIGAVKSSTGGASGTGSGSGVDINRTAQREAALTKFRQKRKERCFEKKVRYQSRKKLAEQRPRVRGQFVRQTAHETANGEGD